VGLFNFFKNRRERESAMPDPSEILAAQGMSTGTEIHGIGDLGTMISQLHQLREAGAELEANNQVIDLRGTDARKEIFEVLKQHGLDPEGGGGTPDDPAAMQADILAALSRAGLDLGGMGVPFPTAAPEPGKLPEGVDADEVRRNPDLGVRNPLDP
jgi:hypothetical protein